MRNSKKRCGFFCVQKVKNYTQWEKTFVFGSDFIDILKVTMGYNLTLIYSSGHIKLYFILMIIGFILLFLEMVVMLRCVCSCIYQCKLLRQTSLGN